MIKERYCSLELSKLLKEKGFDEKTFTYYDDDILCNGGWFEWNRSPLGHISAPTHQMAMDWLREIHKLHIGIERGPRGYHLTIEIIPLGVVKYVTREIVGTNYVESFKDGVEAALKYALENLI